MATATTQINSDILQMTHSQEWWRVSSYFFQWGIGLLLCLYLRQDYSVGNSEVIVTDLSHIKHIDIGDLFA